MTKKCPQCHAELSKGARFSLLFGFKCKCKKCRSKLRSHSIWVFALSVVVVFVAIASLGFINLLGTYGFVVAGLIPIAVFFIGKFFIPLEKI